MGLFLEKLVRFLEQGRDFHQAKHEVYLTIKGSKQTKNRSQIERELQGAYWESAKYIEVLAIVLQHAESAEAPELYRTLASKLAGHSRAMDHAYGHDFVEFLQSIVSLVKQHPQYPELVFNYPDETQELIIAYPTIARRRWLPLADKHQLPEGVSFQIGLPEKSRDTLSLTGHLVNASSRRRTVYLIEPPFSVSFEDLQRIVSDETATLIEMKLEPESRVVFHAEISLSGKPVGNQRLFWRFARFRHPISGSAAVQAT